MSQKTTTVAIQTKSLFNLHCCNYMEYSLCNMGLRYIYDYFVYYHIWAIYYFRSHGPGQVKFDLPSCGDHKLVTKVYQEIAWWYEFFSWNLHMVFQVCFSMTVVLCHEDVTDVMREFWYNHGSLLLFLYMDTGVWGLGLYFLYFCSNEL